MAAPASRAGGATIPLSGAVGVLMGFFALDAMLLPAFLGWHPGIVAAFAVAATIATGILSARTIGADIRIAPSTMLVSAAIAALLLLLGGEGRLFYAMADWQIRDAVLADMGNRRWPFDYWLDGHSQILRAPLGMYLLPALIGGASQSARDWALFAHNLVPLTLLFAIGSTLFDDRRARLVGMAVFIAFSGWDVIGNLLRQSLAGEARWTHIEGWAGSFQYSAHVTQLFWVPQHAMAGWTCALAYLLWRRGLASVGLLAAALPLVALWSPLVLFGALPFAIFAGATVLANGKWSVHDLPLPALAALLALPVFAYLGADAQKLGGGWRTPPPILYAAMMLLEVAPLVLPPLLGRSPDRDRPTLLVAAICLLLMPLWMIGSSGDFQMRGSIMPLALVAVALGEWAGHVRRAGTKLLLMASLALGGVTGMVELWRAVTTRPSPPPHCTLPEAWAQQTGFIVPHDSYFAATAAIPVWLRGGALVDRAHPVARPCWDRRWATPLMADAAKP